MIIESSSDEDDDGDDGDNGDDDDGDDEDDGDDAKNIDTGAAEVITIDGEEEQAANDGNNGCTMNFTVGQQLEIWWPTDQRWYAGKIERFSDDQNMQQVLYADGKFRTGAFNRCDSLKWCAHRLCRRSGVA